jgi:diacylglycerol kinase family enzyme
MRIALAANRASGGGLDPEPLVAAMRAAGAEVVTGGPDELDRLAASRPDRLAIAGGDGSIGPAAALAGRIGVPLGVIPAGTANDFARVQELPDDLEAAARLVADPDAATRPLDIGHLADGHPFVNVASAGLASVAARRAEPLKPRLGPLAYGVGAVRAALREQPLACRVRVDGTTAFAGDAWQVIVAVTGAFGGGAGVEEADPRDGELDVVVIPDGSRIALARRAWGLRTRTIASQEPTEHVRGARLAIDLPPGTEVNADGELRRGGLEAVTVRRAAFRLIAPR